MFQCVFRSAGEGVLRRMSRSFRMPGRLPWTIGGGSCDSFSRSAFSRRVVLLRLVGCLAMPGGLIFMPAMSRQRGGYMEANARGCQWIRQRAE